MSAQISSSEEFFAALADVIDRYLQHFEPGANSQLNAVRMETSGPVFNLHFTKSPHATPYMQFTLQTESTEQTDSERKGLFR